MQKKLVGQNYSFSFDFILPDEEEKKPDDLGIIFHGKCEQTETPVIIRYFSDKKLIKSNEHLQLVKNILISINKIQENTAVIYDCIYDNDGFFIVREQLDGIDLQQIAFSGDYPHLRNAKFLLKVAVKVCEILDVLHKNKIILRRIQPNNIFIVANERGQIDVENPTVKILNTEYAQINGQNILGFSSIPYSLYYSAPELVLQCAPLVNATCDLYSLGITVFESFAREHAFICDNNDKNLLINMQVSFPLKRHHRIPKQIFPLLQKATVKHIFKSPPMRYKQDARTKYFYLAQKERFQSAEEMHIALVTLIENMEAKTNLNLIEKIKSIFIK
ncbi:MAG: protein kinase [Bacteroidales bacterium]|nr:protein kinase [Bacteroidales bacterium]